MNRIINGKKYDTETAIEVASDSAYSSGDFYWYEESLYKKKTGEFFLAGKGGPLSKYAIHNKDGYFSGSKITPLSEEEARAWGEENMSVSYFEEIFGEVAE